MAEAIRNWSAASQLISEQDILGLVKAHHFIPPGADRTSDSEPGILAQLVRKNDDLRKLTGAGSHYYYSAHSMTGAYATILLHKLEGPLPLIAGTVRQSAREYQRPVPLSIFSDPPFDLPYQQVLDCLEAMAKAGGYDDIAATSTSTSAIYLYSTSHLEAEHAAMLAEWLDVGQSDSP
jgi:hypothetical protein